MLCNAGCESGAGRSGRLTQVRLIASTTAPRDTSLYLAPFMIIMRQAGGVAVKGRLSRRWVRPGGAVTREYTSWLWPMVRL